MLSPFRLAIGAEAVQAIRDRLSGQLQELDAWDDSAEGSVARPMRATLATWAAGETIRPRSQPQSLADTPNSFMALA
jgi:hypothetical protein